jgi:LysR family glycine cleavage system transcriptional activator
MINRYPSLTGLRAFEAASRYLSFTRAAIELNLTQTAISHQIKTLEELLGTKLFIRKRNTIELTQAAIEYCDSIRSVLAEIAIATDRASRRSGQKILTITSPQAYAIKFLLPRLDEFRSLQPDIAIQIRAVLSYEQMVRHDYDVAIRYGSGNAWRGWHAERLTWEELFPVCSPKFSSARRLKIPTDLASCTAIRSSSRSLPDEWPGWLGFAGVPDLRFKDEIVCDLMLPALQGALDGLGVAIGRRAVAERDLADGRLIAPFDLNLRSSFGYFIVAPPERAALPHVGIFRDWLLACSQKAGLLEHVAHDEPDVTGP